MFSENNSKWLFGCIGFILGGILMLPFLKITTAESYPPVVIQTNISADSTRKFCDSLQGQFLHTLLDLSTEQSLSVYQSLHISAPTFVFVVKRLDCGKCYNFQSEKLQQEIQAGSDVLVITSEYIETIERDFRKKEMLFPPIHVGKFLEKFPFDMALFCILPNGLIIYANIPVLESPSKSIEFYRQSAVLVKQFHRLKRMK